MRLLRLVFVSEEYNDYLVKHCCAYIRKKGGNMARPYMLVPGKINGHRYCIPLTSPKAADYVAKQDGSLDVKEDFPTRVRLGHKHFKTGKPEVLGCLVLSRMIPVPESEIIPCVINQPKHSKGHRLLLNLELSAAKAKNESILKKVDLVYKMMTESSIKHQELRAKIKGDIVDFTAAEEACMEFKKQLSRGLSREEILDSVSHMPDIFIEETYTEDTKTSSGSAAEKSEKQAAVEEEVSLPESQMKSAAENMDKMKFVYISEAYTEYLARCCNPEDPIEGHKHGRMFVQVPHTLNGHTYCVPLSSPKDSDYSINEATGERTPKPNSLQVTRVVLWSQRRKCYEVKFSMRNCRMIPTPLSEIIPYDPAKETRERYKKLIETQKKCIAGLYTDIIMSIVSLYNMKVGAISKSDSYRRVDAKLFTLNFRKAEDYCTKFEKCVEKGIRKEDISDYVMLSLSEADGAPESESLSYGEEQPGCSSWGVSSSRHGEDEYRYSDSPDGGRKRKYRDEYNNEESGSVRRRLSESHGESSRDQHSSHSRSYSGKGKGKGKGRSRHHTPTR